MPETSKLWCIQAFLARIFHHSSGLKNVGSRLVVGQWRCQNPEIPSTRKTTVEYFNSTFQFYLVLQPTQ